MRTLPAAALAIVLAAAPARADKCQIATKGDSSVVKACKSGGTEAAAKEMKRMVRAAKAKGHKFTCDGCHDEDKDNALTKNAKDDYKKLLEVVQ